ncbi:unnamed protein product, partial [Urochloa humidicola]
MAVKPGCHGGLTGSETVRPVSQPGQTGPGLRIPKVSKSEYPGINGGKDRLKHKGKKPKLTFDELLAKYQRDNEAKRASRTSNVKSAKIPPKHNSRDWSRQKKESYSAASYSSSKQPMPMPYHSHQDSVHPCSPWGWHDPWVCTPSYFKPYHVEYAAPREPVYARQPYIENDRFKPKNRSRVYEKKKVVKQVYVVKRDGRKDAGSDLNSINKKPINVLETSASDGKEKKNSAIDFSNAKSEQSKLKEPKIKKEVLLSRIEIKSKGTLSSSNWEKKKLQKLSAQELKKRGMAWVPKRSIQTQDKGDVEAKGAAQLKEKRRSRRRSSNMRFAPNYQNYWSLHHPYALQMPHMPMSWNSSIDTFGYPSCYNFNPWPYGYLHYG